MSRYIDADAYKAAHKNAYEAAMMECGKGEDTKLARKVYDAIINSVDAISSADVVKVVRCKDCIHGDLFYPYCTIWEAVIDGDGYCYKGEKINEVKE